MPINTTHPYYSAAIEQWKRSRDAASGTDAIRAGGHAYLPPLSGQTTNEYKAYRNRGLYFNMTARILQGFSGVISAQQVDVDAGMPASEQDNFKNSTMEMIRSIANELLLIGRVGVMVDAPEEGGDPYLCIYGAESILNWSMGPNGLTRVVLSETVEQPNPNDKYDIQLIDQIRELMIDADGHYKVQLWRAKPKSNKFEEYGALRMPLLDKTPFAEIPFVMANTEGISASIITPPMLDIVDVNLSHFRSSCDLEHGRHFTALPTPVVIGVESSTVLKIGSNKAWILPSPDADAKYLEFTGQGLHSLETALKEKQSQIAQFSARLMDTSTRGSESTETVRIRYNSDTSVIINTTYTTEQLLNAANVIRNSWSAKKYPRISINKDINSGRLSAQELKELTNSWLEGAIDDATLIFNLRRGKMMPQPQP